MYEKLKSITGFVKWDKLEIFDENEINNIKHIINRREMGYLSLNSTHRIIKINDKINQNNIHLQVNTLIYKFPDEWYYVYDDIDKNHYKCDQFDGLLSCINNLPYMRQIPTKRVIFTTNGTRQYVHN